MMKNLIYLSILWLGLQACEKKDTNPPPVTIKYELRDSTGTPKTRFQYGENIYFSFRITNHSDSMLCYKPFMAYSEFSKVYALEEGKKNLVGRAFEDIIIELRGGQNIISPKSSVGDVIPWVRSDTIIWYPPGFLYGDKKAPLKVGNYYTGFIETYMFYPKNNNAINYDPKTQKHEIFFEVYEKPSVIDYQ